MRKMPRLKKIKFIFLFLALCFCELTGAIPYKVEFLGIEDPRLLSTLRQLSDLEKRKGQVPETVTALRHRANEDNKSLTKALNGLGYYEAQVRTEFEEEAQSMRVTLAIDLGPLYTLASFTVLSVTDHQPPYEDLESWSLQPDETIDLNAFFPCLGEELLQKPAIASHILDREKEVVYQLANQGYPFARVYEREAVADQSMQQLHVSLYVNTGPLLYFGETTWTGLDSVYPSVIMRRISWCPGDLYRQDQLEEAQKSILKTKLFALVDMRVPPVDQLKEDLQLPVEIYLKEAKQRTVGFGASYQTNRGAGGNAFWEHRNLWGQGERLMARVAVQKLHNRGEINYRRPDFFHVDQSLTAFLTGEYEQTEGYTERELSLGTRIDRVYADCLSIWAGAGIKQQRVREFGGATTDSTLAIFPLGIRYTDVDDLLNPTKGYTALARTTPFISISKVEETWVAHELLLTAYYPLSCQPLLVLAAKGHWGCLWGASRLDIPAPERFYAGSANSLRGYGYRSVGPSGPPGTTPTGGRSLMLYAVEGRLHYSEDLEFVTFFDAGNVYERSLPQFDQRLLKAVGFGARYHTPIGPLRADMAFPLDRRPGQDDEYEVYVSIGQAF